SGCPIFLLLIAGALAAGTLYFANQRGWIKLPDFMSFSSPQPEEKPRPPAPGTEQSNVPPPDTAKLAPPSPATTAPKTTDKTPAVAERRPLYPAVKAQDLERARSCYAKGDFAGAGRSLEGCERSEVEDAATTTQARVLVKKARIFDVLTGRIKPNALATAPKLEQITLDSGGTFVGKVISESDDELKLLVPGGIEMPASKDKIATRKPVARSVLEEKLKTRLDERERSLKPDRAGGYYSLAYYCWQYGLQQDAVPYLDKAVEKDDFPCLIRVFGGNDSDSLIQTWCELTGKPNPESQKQPPLPADPTIKSSGKPDPKALTPKLPSDLSGDPVKNMNLAQGRHDEGVKFFRDSFGDSAQSIDNLHRAHGQFQEALLILEKVPDSTPGKEKLLTQCQMLLADVRKRWR
ncbi:hypothetical protein HY251_03985, partial [bacterium]|nr:hypothetical protein [bacterium]